MLFFQILPVWVFIFAMELIGKSNERASKSFEMTKGYAMFIHYQPTKSMKEEKQMALSDENGGMVMPQERFNGSVFVERIRRRLQNGTPEHDPGSTERLR